jgi:hypothetical protein
MSKKAVKKEYIILGALIAALLLYLVFKGTNKVHYQLPELKPIDVNTLTRIEITNSGQTITLIKKDDQWLIDSFGYPVEISTLNDITNDLKGLAITDLASRSKNYTLYDLGKDKAIQVKAYRNDEVVRDFEVGKAASTYNHGFVKLKDDDRVFLASQIYRVHFDKNLKDFRSKQVMKLDKNEISEITIDMIKDGKKFLFAKTAKPAAAATTPAKTPESKKDEKQPAPSNEAETTWTMPDGKEGNTATLDALLAQLSDLRCFDFIEGKKKEEFNTPIYTVKLKGKKDYVVSVFEKSGVGPKDAEGESEMYPAVSSENAYPFMINSYTVDALMKKTEDLLKK